MAVDRPLQSPCGLLHSIVLTAGGGWKEYKGSGESNPCQVVHYYPIKGLQQQPVKEAPGSAISKYFKFPYPSSKSGEGRLKMAGTSFLLRWEVPVWAGLDVPGTIRTAS
ncbi:hypothetical protein L3X38_025215 [Prunus dulcis]|uniref:Uncharacterized protein n=1 Tax=Prunus dulcis TaxID=3755 RepID=A0AAD4W368_PRUDU|nr:hypothetical protein L3X38_025215 [Prunus dulcis]